MSAACTRVRFHCLTDKKDTSAVDLSEAPNHLHKGEDGGRKDLGRSHETEEQKRVYGENLKKW